MLLSDGRAQPGRSMDEDEPDPTVDRRRTLRRWALITALGCVLVPLWAAHGDRVRAYVRGEADLGGEPRFVPPHPVDREALAEIDFDRVHRELVPAWSIAVGRANASESSTWRRHMADQAFGRLAEAVARDPNVLLLLDHSHRALRGDPIEGAARVDYWLWAYNHYLDENDIPWRLEASLSLTEDGRAIFRTMTYEVLADARTSRGHRVRFLRRADRTSLVEGWLGHTTRTEEGAMVLMAQVLHFAVRHVWPGLHAGLDARRPLAERPWLEGLREEVRGALDRRTWELLAETAEDQQALIEVAASIEARHACGSTLEVYDLPYNGLNARSRMAIAWALERSATQAYCPEITLDEATALIGASERLGDTPGLEDAVERLAMIVARAVAAHELRHVADGPSPDCPGCEEETSALARAEMSAYLSSYATRGVGYIALLQACATPRGNGAHGGAREAVLTALLPRGCEGPPIDLYEEARALEARLFGEREELALPEDLPERVALLPR